ncbi:FGGY-family carbohydrate kinase [Gibbsiella quercinecans]|uniref:FGGY-family carbohydrate kinase n=1 Tax=Gibbsiella quercinecans TaxID=929813 RepID=UPI000EF1516B|nr:FGGY-family carbohydrate kinase [Gibbsiella quercinecans]RLM04253.1 sugar kinase [Gibbsiella quercinecans]
MGSGYFLGVDVGSASVRAGVYDASGTRLGFATRPVSQFRPGGERVEQSSAEIWRQVCLVVKEAVATAGIPATAIRSLGFDATCSLVALDARGEGLAVSPGEASEHDIIMWMDHRATAEAERINATQDPALRYVGGEVSVEMELPKVLWLKNHFPATWQRTHRFFDLADFLVWKATGNDVAGLCTLTCKWNYLAHEQRFSRSLLAAVGLTDLLGKIPTRILPPGAAAGTLNADAAQALGLTTDVVVASGMIDAHAGGVALAGVQPAGTLALISGTSNCHMLCSEQEIHTAGVWGPYWSAMLPGYWLTEGGQSAAGSLVDWTLQEAGASAGLFRKAEQRGCHPVVLVNEWVAALEEKEPEPTRNLHVLADHHGNRSPRARPDARGSVCGLTLESGEPQLARLYLATLQAIACGTRHIMDAMRESGHTISRLTLCGGATHNALWLREYADATGCDIHLMQEEDAVTLGAAITGAVASGSWPDFSSACQAMVAPGEVIKANPARQDFFERKYQVYLALWEQQQVLNRLMQ